MPANSRWDLIRALKGYYCSEVELQIVRLFVFGATAPSGPGLSHSRGF